MDNTYLVTAVTSADRALISSLRIFCSSDCRVSRDVTSSKSISKNSASKVKGTSTRFTRGFLGRESADSESSELVLHKRKHLTIKVKIAGRQLTYHLMKH
jgi:hypothetical protein